MRVADLPEMDFEGMAASDALVKFFVNLGWKPEKQKLDPKKVRLSEADRKTFIEKLELLHPENKEGVLLMWLDKGPSCNMTVKDGKVHLYAGWVEAD